MSKECVVCEAPLTGAKRNFCSNTCKQKAKYQQAKGERCKYCKQAMKPVPVVGGMKQNCSRKACLTKTINRRKVAH